MCQVHPIQLKRIHRTDRLVRITTQHQSHYPSYRMISTTHKDFRNIVSDYLETTTAVSLQSSVVSPTSDFQHIILYVPYETTYILNSKNNNTNINDSTSASNITTTTMVQIERGLDDVTTDRVSRIMSFVSIINPGESVVSAMDAIYDRYIVNCLSIPSWHIDNRINDTISKMETDLTVSEYNNRSHSSHTDNRSVIAKNRQILSFYSKLYFHRTFFSLWNRVERLHREIQVHKPQWQHSNECHYDNVPPWSRQHSSIRSARHQLQEMVNQFSRFNSSSIYSSNYVETYTFLLQMEDSTQRIKIDLQPLQQNERQQGELWKSIELEAVIYDLPIEQYMAIFGPLLFPLLVPLFMTLFREYIRYRQRMSSRAM
jgi:Phosphatidylinositol-glycan biosynthesis class S protein